MSDKKELALRDGQIVSENIQDELKVCSYMLKSGMLPKSFKTVEEVVVARQFLVSMGFKAFLNLRNVCVINGTPSLFGEAALSLPFASGKIKTLELKQFDKELNEISFANKNIKSETFGVLVRCERADIHGVNEFTYTVDDAKKAGLFKNDVWSKYTVVMLRRRTMQHAFKMMFPDLLTSISFAEHDYNLLPDMQEIKDVNYTHEGTVNNAAQLNERLNNSINTTTAVSEQVESHSEGPNDHDGRSENVL